MSKIAFSLLVHEKPLVILEQVVNVLTFNPNSIVVLHFNPNFNDNDSLKKEDLLNLLKDYKRVYINDHSVKVSLDNIIQGHLSNFHYIENVEFDYFCLIASNEMFVSPGAETFVEQYDYGCFHNKDENWAYYEKMSKDLSLKNILNKEPVNGYFLSQVEGSFYSKDIFRYMVRLIEMNFNYLKQEQIYPREEIYFSSITGNYFADCKKYCKCICFIKWKRALFISIRDVKKVIKSPSLFSVKRVDRNSRNYLREYIRKYVAVSLKTGEFEKIESLLPKNHLNIIQITMIDLFWRLCHFGRAFLVSLKRLFTRKRRKK